MATQIKSDEISSILKKQLESLDLASDTYETGTVLQVGDGIARVFGLSQAMAGELVEVQTKSGAVSGLVLNLEADNVGVAILGSDAEVKEAAEYFAKLPPRKWIRVVETDTAPRTYVGIGNKRLVHPEGGTEPIGQRIIEVPEDEEQSETLRNPKSGFLAYVPPGSLARGADLVTTGGATLPGGPKTVACITCHGPKLEGVADIPAIAGRSPSYLARQMWDMQQGTRKGALSALMKPGGAAKWGATCSALAKKFCTCLK